MSADKHSVLRQSVLFLTGLVLAGPMGFATPQGTKPSSSPRNQAAKILPAGAAVRLRFNESYGKLPLAFEPNMGQTDSQVQFLSRGAGYTLFLTGSGAVLALHKAEPESAGLSKGSKSLKSHPPKPLPPDVVRLTLSGAQNNLSFQGLEKLPGISNYFVGEDSAKWHVQIPQYARAQAVETYPGVDMTYYGNQGHLEYDFTVKPGADPGLIRMKVEGADKTEISPEGNMEISIGGRKVVFHAPTLYQVAGGSRMPVEGKFIRSSAGEIGFGAKGYDKSKPLVIDPELDYSTYLGGTDYGDSGNGIAVDSNGNSYVVGSTESSDFPTTTGAFQTSHQGTTGTANAFVSKLNAAGTALVYSTYLGGTGSNGDFGNGVAVDTNGNAYVAGLASSTDFPTTSGAYQTAGGNDAFITELGSDGSTLVYSTYLGNGGDQANGIALDSAGNAYITGNTAVGGIPTTGGAFQTSSGDGNNTAFAAKLNAAGSDLVYSTYLSGNNLDYGNGIAVDSNGNAYVVGTTQSSNFPTTTGAFQTAHSSNGGQTNAFVAKLNSTGTSLIYSTYLGGNGGDAGQGIAVDSGGNAYVTGNTTSTNFPTTSGAYETDGNGGYTVAFVTKLNAIGAELDYSTYLGGAGGPNTTSGGAGIAVDANGYAYVTGNTSDPTFPTTSGAFQTAYGSGSLDAILAQLDPSGGMLDYSTFLGEGGDDYGTGIGMDSAGNVYLTGVAQGGFPTTSGAYQTAFGGGYYTAFTTKFDQSNFYTPTPCGYPGSTCTFTPTPDNTSTPTATPSPTATISPTWTSTPNGTFTPTPSLIPTSTPTPTQTPTPGVGGSGFTLNALPPPGGSYVAPNPVTGNTAVVAYNMASSGTVDIRVYNAIGQFIAKQDEMKPSGPQTSALNVGGYAPGVYLYLIKLTYDSGGTETLPVGKFIKE